MDDDFDKTHNLMTMEELSQIDKGLKKTEEEGVKNILKYFDRIHDKLFTFNNILIAGYFALSKINNSMSVASILIPIANLMLLLFIEYRMMEKSRFEASITQKPVKQINKHGKAIANTNLYSLLTIGTTLIVTMIFLYHFLK
jgi:hypothetical protein